MPNYTREQIAEILARRTLRSGSFNENLKHYHQVLVSGSLTMGSLMEDKLLSFKDDFLSLRGIDSTDYDNLLNLFETVTGSYWAQQHKEDFGGEMNPPLTSPPNVSQFINFESGSLSIDPDKLNEVLNTDIFELIPREITRQDQINKFFQLYFKLRTSSPPPYCTDGQTGAVTLDLYDQCGNGITYDEWRDQNDISFDADMEGLFITRLNAEANSDNILYEGSSENDYTDGTFQTLEWIYRDLERYLYDLNNAPAEGVIDTRPDYMHRSNGYLKIRNLNQSIIIKKGEGPNVGIGEEIVLDTGLDWYNDGVCVSGCNGADVWTSVLGYNVADYIEGISVPKYLLDGFTITMWVKFLDKVNGGTLFNFGNPVRFWDPVGIKLETFTLKQDDHLDKVGVGPGFYNDNNYERFVRLIVREGDGSIRDSNFGTGWDNRLSTKDIDVDIYNANTTVPLFNYTRIPVDFGEWYFIVAGYSPSIDEDTHEGSYMDNTDFWLGNVDPDSGDAFTHRSGYGARCKVEIISKSDLLRARGYKPIEEE